MTSGEDYANRLQQETRRSLGGCIGGIEQELHNLHNQLSAAATQISQELSSIRDLEVPGLDSVLSDLSAEIRRDCELRKSQEMASLAHFTHGMREKET